MRTFHISLMELSDIQESAKVLSFAMLNKPLHIAVFQGNGDNQRLEIERMFIELFYNFPGITFLAKERDKIVGVMRMKSCMAHKTEDEMKEQEDEKDINYRKNFWLREWSIRDPAEKIISNPRWFQSRRAKPTTLGVPLGMKLVITSQWVRVCKWHKSHLTKA